MRRVPLISTEQGFPDAVSLRLIFGLDNEMQGNRLGNFYRCPILRDSPQGSPERHFVVMALPEPLPTLTYCPMS